ncbi:MAG: hypothetical protein M0R06_01635 [Sphaerochaeta sp.]|jgi:hypothetical protein|nr:hypothetical protein [Sphaerochaeta sp.]
MADRATVLHGQFQKVTIGTYKVLGAGVFSLSGLSRKTHDVSEFGDDIDVFEFGTADGGTISVNNVLYDPTDTTGQALLDSACLNKSKFTSGDLRFWVNSTSYRTVASGGHILITKSHSLEGDRNGLGRCSFDGKVSGGAMVLV